jgi:hypothetical protein
MAEVLLELQPDQAKYDPGIQPPQLRQIDGTNFAYPGLFFDAGTIETCFFFFRAVRYPNAGNLSVDIEWVADTATSGNVVWGASIAAVTPETDSGSTDSKAFATENTVTDGHLGTNARRIMRCTVTVSNLDSLATDDWVVLRIRRVASDGGDTMSGDAGIVKTTVRYSDT